ncbi:MAG: ATP-binding protein, partial [Gammaproteobacteria bacterium]
RSLKYVLSTTKALSAGVCARLELGMLRSSEIANYQLLLQQQNLFVYILLMSIVWLVDIQLCTARRWMAYLITAMWSIGLIINYVTQGSLVYESITELKQQTVFWGEQFTIASGVENPWVWLVNVATLLILIYVIDASIKAWRQKDTQSAMVIGGGIVIFLLFGLVHSVLVDTGILESPYMVSFAYLAMVMAMSYDLVSDAVRVPQLTLEIQANEKRWRDLLENVKLAVVGFDERGRINYTNPFFQQITGFKSSDLIEKDITTLISPKEAAMAKKRIQQAAETGPRPHAQWSIVCKSGEERQFVWSSVRQKNTDGSYGGIISVGSDITEQLKAQSELQQSQHEMERLTRASVLGELTSALAHEVNQPLAAILSNSQAALRFMENEQFNVEELREILEDIVRDDKRAGDVIRSLRAMLTKSEIASEQFLIKTAINEVTTILHSELEEQQITLHLDVDSDAPEITARRIEIQQVLMNLLLNAGQAMKELPPEERNIEIRVARRENSVAISVADSGPGISQDDLPNVFNAFFTTKSESMGMGLAICQRIVKAHGGQITVENRPQGGAVFRFTLPA